MARVFRQAKRGCVVLELSCGCKESTELLPQHADRPELLRGSSRPMHRCWMRDVQEIKSAALN